MKINDRAIRAMPYDTRLKHYEREKEELFFQIRDMSPNEVSEAHRRLAQKWRI